mmetsp:Transcript_10117/g.11493  ORF Transcript_10117/g.11493 Transcript_10117/m.11493 type:complete len:80 (-) Transcript_10117:543-782(-)
MSKRERKQSKQALRYYKEPMSAQIIEHPTYKETKVRERLPSIDIIKRREMLDAIMNSSKVESKKGGSGSFPYLSSPNKR